MFTVSFLQIIILLLLVFLLFSDFKNLKSNILSIKKYIDQYKNNQK